MHAYETSARVEVVFAVTGHGHVRGRGLVSWSCSGHGRGHGRSVANGSSFKASRYMGQGHVRGVTWSLRLIDSHGQGV